jgi:hypothetical protein
MIGVRPTVADGDPRRIPFRHTVIVHGAVEGVPRLRPSGYRLAPQGPGEARPHLFRSAGRQGGRGDRTSQP